MKYKTLKLLQLIKETEYSVSMDILMIRKMLRIPIILISLYILMLMLLMVPLKMLLFRRSALLFFVNPLIKSWESIALRTSIMGPLTFLLLRKYFGKYLRWTSLKNYNQLKQQYTQSNWSKTKNSNQKKKWEWKFISY